MMWGVEGLHRGWGIFGAFSMLVFWGGLACLIIWGLRSSSASKDDRRDKSSMEMAQERYAKGEITRQEFEEIQHALRS